MFLLVINMHNVLDLFSKKPLHHLEIYEYLDSEDKCLEAIRDSGVKQWLNLKNEFTVQDIFKLDNPGSQMKDYPNGRKIGDESGTTESDKFSLSSKIILDAIVFNIKSNFNISDTIDPKGFSEEYATELTKQKNEKNEARGKQLKLTIVEYSESIIRKISELEHSKGLIKSFNDYLTNKELISGAVHDQGNLGAESQLSYAGICGLTEASSYFICENNKYFYHNNREVGEFSKTQDTTLPIHLKVIYDGVFFSVVTNFITKNCPCEFKESTDSSKAISKKNDLTKMIVEILAEELKKRQPQYYSQSQMHLFAGIALFAGLLIAGACLSNPIIMILATVALIADIIALTCNRVYEHPHMRMI
jgi:hypothetical protein